MLTEGFEKRTKFDDISGMEALEKGVMHGVPVGRAKEKCQGKGQGEQDG